MYATIIFSIENALNLDSLLIQLQPEVNEKWYQLGEALGIEKKTLDKYASYLPDQNIIEVCDYWLRNHTGQPSWNEVAAALKQIGFQQLGYDIERVYETGIPNSTIHHLAIFMMLLYNRETTKRSQYECSSQHEPRYVY